MVCLLQQTQYAAASHGRPGVQRDDSRTVFVRNLPFRATEADIEAFFAQAGTVEDVRRRAGDDGELTGSGSVVHI